MGKLPGSAVNPDVDSRVRGLLDLLVVIAEVLVDIHHVAQVLDRVGRDPCVLHLFGGIPLAQAARPIGDRRFNLILARLATDECLQVGSFGPIGSGDGPGKRGPLFVRLERNRHPLIISG